MSRTQRQELIEEWKPEKLKECSVGLVGSDSLSNYILTELLGLGVGKIYLIDDREISNSRDSDFGFLLKLQTNRLPSKVKSLEKIANKINEEVELYGIHSYFHSFLVDDIDILIDSTNDPYSKANCEKYSKSKKIPFISCSASRNKSVVTFSKMEKLELLLSHNKNKKWFNGDFKNQKQGDICTLPIGSVVTEEVRKYCFSLSENDKNLQIPLIYNLESNQRTKYDSDFHINIGDFFWDKKALVVGAGALGNFVGLGLALMNVGNIDIVDNDIVELHNLNRQILFYDSVGQKKAEALANKLKEINPKLKNINYYNSKFDDGFESIIKEKNYDVIYSCVDNYKSRALLNKLAAKNNIPFINGGTSAFSGNSSVFIKNYTPCLDCQIGIDSKIKLEEERETEFSQRSCRFADPSVVMSNAVTAGSMLAETRPIFNSLIYGKPNKNIFKYNMKNKNRIFYTLMPSPNSECEYCGGNNDKK